MCGRFTLNQPEKIEQRFEISTKLPQHEPNYNIAPSFTVPIIRKIHPIKQSWLNGDLFHTGNTRSRGLLDWSISEAKPVKKNPIVKMFCWLPDALCQQQVVAILHLWAASCTQKKSLPRLNIPGRQMQDCKEMEVNSHASVYIICTLRQNNPASSWQDIQMG